MQCIKHNGNIKVVKGGLSRMGGITQLVELTYFWKYHCSCGVGHGRGMSGKKNFSNMFHGKLTHYKVSDRKGLCPQLLLIIFLGMS